MKTPLLRVSRRLPKAEINVVPYIDVMLVLLVIFMVVSPLSPIGEINVPRAGQANAPPVEYLELGLKEKGDSPRFTLALRRNQSREEIGVFVTQEEALARLTKKYQAQPQLAVLIAAEKNLRYEEVVQLMNAVKASGVVRIGLATQ